MPLISKSAVFGHVAAAAAHRKGFQTEDKVLEAFRVACVSTPVWFRDIQHGSFEQESKGIDFVITSDVGPLYLQIKSSKGGAEKFKLKQDERRYNQHIAVVVIDDFLTNEQICLKIFGVLKPLRAKILEFRNGHS